MAGHLKRNLAVGLLAGLAGTAVMDQYWRVLAKTKPDWVTSGEEPSTQKAARKLLQNVGVRSPSRRIRKRGGEAVHWGTGLTWGLAVGAASAAGVPITWGGGQLFGTGVWALSDEWLKYKMELGKHPRERSRRDHVSALGAHLSYGLGVWAVMKTLAGKGAQKRGSLRRAA